MEKLSQKFSWCPQDASMERESSRGNKTALRSLQQSVLPSLFEAARKLRHTSVDTSQEVHPEASSSQEDSSQQVQVSTLGLTSKSKEQRARIQGARLTLSLSHSFQPSSWSREELEKEKNIKSKFYILIKTYKFIPIPSLVSFLLS